MKTFRLAATIALAAGLLSGCTVDAPERACAGAVRPGDLPGWARAGFSDPAGVPFALGEREQILGVVFGDPLTAPTAGPDRANKILWVANPATAGDSTAAPDLTIDARLAGSAEVVHREVPGGPGPSIIDLPAPGCWRLTLTWSGRTDHVDLQYAEQRPVAQRAGMRATAP